MSGGHFDYIDQRAKNEIFGYFGDEQKFVYTEKSTALMENIHQFAKYGITISGLYKTIEHKPWGDVELLGIIFAVN